MFYPNWFFVILGALKKNALICPQSQQGSKTQKFSSIVSDDSRAEPIKLLNFPYSLGPRYLYGDPSSEAIFTNNETNNKLLFNADNVTSHTKDGFHDYIIHGKETVNKEQKGTKAALHYSGIEIPAGKSHVIHLRFSPKALDDPLADVEEIVAKRKQEADRFYDEIHPKGADSDAKNIQRQALSGMLWSKQLYLFNVNRWFAGDAIHQSLPDSRKHLRNVHWKHLISKRILSMPDKWEYPWFAAWDLSFHCVSLALVDIEFAKEQLWLLLFDQFQHPNGQIPAYEWEFSDLNPPVQAWGAWRPLQDGRGKAWKARQSLFEKMLP